MIENINPNKFIDIQVDFEENSEGLVIEKFQEIPQYYIDSLRSQKDASTSARAGETMRVASIPTIIVEKWLKEGYDFDHATAAQIVAKLKAENLDYFLTTGKQV